MTEAANLSRRDAVASVSLRRLGKTFGEHIAVRELTLDIAEGEFFALLGPSGCGKTTTLRMIGGFEEPTSGDILVHGESMRGRPPFRRNVNTVFQSYALFPHLNVRDNVAFGLRMHGVGRKERAVRAERALERMHLLGVGHRAINEISGGQQQRVALARALVNEPAVLLLDEPLGALDLKLRRAMQTELKAIQRDVGITFVYVTHDQEEALTMADRIAVMHDGAALQVGTPREIYEHPTGRFVASFIGESTFLEGTCTGADGAHITLSLPTGEAVRAAGSGPPGGAVTVMVRPERIQVVLPGVQHSAELNEVAATVRSLDYAGASVVCHLERSDGEAVYARIAVDDTADLHPGRSVRVLFEPVHAVVLADDAQPAASDDGEAR